MNRKIERLAAEIIARGTAAGRLVATAESCTGGLIAGALTEVPGSSAVFDRGFVTYTNDAKSEMLGVDPGLIASRGAVSAEVATAMAAGAFLRSDAHIAVAVTGIAGPTGGTADKPVGTVWFALAVEDEVIRAEKRVFAGGSRRFVRERTVETALRLILPSV
ncbi:MAG: CinA family protein [Pseudomonadota bacterium]